MKKKKKRFFSDFEMLCCKSGILIVIFLIIGIVCSETSLAQVNLEVQKTEKEVLYEKKKIDSLEMKIDEMTSLDRIKEISLEYGLSYIAENVKNVK